MSDEHAPPPVEVLGERLKERIYALLSVVAVTAGLALGDTHSAVAAAASVAATAAGLWLATVAADQQSHRVLYGRLARGHDLGHMLYVTSPLLTAAIGPLIMVGLAALGVLPLVTALWVSVGVDAAALFAWGLLAGRRMGAGLFPALVSGAVNLVIGGLVVAVKLLAH
ncbi:hypothetical protein [Actinomycetospora termitidis]|uniref:Integral membrane protein n=1 Tax=Actinomycetospora termitidis TaxID=3053470 RepID=A0ABT7M3T6_9PSEU|nr:hypothetical protein [Actinomycetospora sp. Odt1-22]MDL5154874.1 hypothetical protein [Actinomycetospora sp. Odt1-22]